jgi:hypothetical protein
MDVLLGRLWRWILRIESLTNTILQRRIKELRFNPPDSIELSESFVMGRLHLLVQSFFCGFRGAVYRVIEGCFEDVYD